MKVRLLLLILFVSSIMQMHPGNIKHIKYTYEYVSDNQNETPEQAKQKALVRAKQKAIEENFGLDVIGVTSVLQHSRTDGEDILYNKSEFSLSETSVRGEWVETITESVLEQIYNDGFWHIKVYVEGMARDNSTEKVQVKYAFVNNEHDRLSRDQYYDGDNIFLRFSAPVSGSLCVYLVDEDENVYCLLPYRTMANGCQNIKANKEYLFFSEKEYQQADEYTLNTQKNEEHNMLYIVFTPNNLTKANDNNSGQNWRNEQLPRQLTYQDFKKWLYVNQMKDKDIVVHADVITIRK